MKDFQEAALHLRRVMQNQLNTMSEGQLQYLLEHSYDLIYELKQYRLRLSLVLYKCLNKSNKNK